MKLIKTLTFALVLLFSTPAFATEHLTILHFNDLHGYVDVAKGSNAGNADRLATVIKRIEEENRVNGFETLVFFGGDAFTGTAISSIFKGDAEFAFFKAIGVDAMAAGNHDFDYGKAVFEKEVEAAPFPVLGANVIENGHIWNGLKGNTIIEIKPDLKIGLIGVMRKRTPLETKKTNVTGISFTDPIKTAKKEFNAIKDKSTIQIALAHMGVDGEVELAKKITGIDLVISGHSHVKPGEYCRLTKKIESCETPAKGEYLGRIDLEIDGNKVTSLSKKLIKIDDSISPSAEVARELAPFRKKSATIISTVITTTDKDLAKTGKLGDLIADSIREKTKTDVAIINEQGIRSSLKKGKITVGDIFEVLPFDNALVTMQVSGAFLEKLLQSRKSERLIFSGLTYKKELEGVADIMIAGKPLNADATYSLSTVDFLASGGSGYGEFTKIGDQKDLGIFIRDCFIDYLKKR